jgi:hypothetical protein
MRIGFLGLLLLFSGCVGGEGAPLPRGLRLAIEDPDGIVALDESSELPLSYGLEGGLTARLRFGPEVADACIPPEGFQSSCRGSMTLDGDFGTVETPWFVFSSWKEDRPDWPIVATVYLDLSPYSIYTPDQAEGLSVDLQVAVQLRGSEIATAAQDLIVQAVEWQ